MDHSLEVGDQVVVVVSMLYLYNLYAVVGGSHIRYNLMLAVKCIERECNLARPKVDWRMHEYYVEL